MAVMAYGTAAPRVGKTVVRPRAPGLIASAMKPSIPGKPSIARPVVRAKKPGGY